MGTHKAAHLPRFPELDLMRGIGILLVVIYHIFFDLAYFGLGNWLNNPVVWAIGRLAAVILIGIAGVSLSIAIRKWRGREGEFGHHAKRILFLLGVALLITLATWVYPHDGFIFFGIMHFLAFASIVGFLIGRSQMAVGVLLVLSLPVWFMLQTQYSNDFVLAVLGEKNGIYTLDLYTIFPWIGLFCAGMLIGEKIYGKKERKIRFKFAITNPILQWMGQNSLAIYLLHQPILIGLLMLLGIRA